MIRPLINLPDLFVTQLRGVMRKDHISSVYVHKSTCCVLYPCNCKHLDKLCKKCDVRISHDYNDLNDYEKVNIDDMKLSPTCLW